MIHPTISGIIKMLKTKGYDDKKAIDKKALLFLKYNNTSFIQAIIALHLGFGFSDKEAEDFVIDSNLWEREDIENIAYQTFLYMNYNPDDPDFSDDGETVRFPLK